MKHTKKTRFLVGVAGVAMCAIPVVASHTVTSLRGSFPGQNIQGHGASSHADAYVCQDCAAQTWQHERLVQRLRPAQDIQHYEGQHITHKPYGGYGNADVYVAQVQAPVVGLRSASQPFHTNQYDYVSPEHIAATSHGVDVGGLSFKTSVANSRRLLDFQENQTGRTISLLANRAVGIIEPDSFYVGGALRGGFMYQRTSNAGQFPLLSRFPFFSERTDREAGVFAIQNAALSFTTTLGDWTTLFLQTEYSETEYGRFQDELQLRKAFVVFGNLERTPFYAAFGRKIIDFGNFDTYSPFTHNEAAHYFLAQSDQPVLELGYYKNGLKLTGSAFSGGRQLRVAFADENNNIANYAFNAEKEFRMRNGGAFTIGGGYLHDTIYRNNWTAHTFGEILEGNAPENLIEYRNSAVSAFAEYNSKFFDAMVEYTTTLEPWAAAIPQDADGFVIPEFLIDPNGSPNSRDNINFDQNLEVIVAQARIKPIVNGRPLRISAVGSWGNIGTDYEGVGLMGQPTTWEDNQQHTLSVEYALNDYVDFGAEYVYNKGFIPFVAPQLVSNDETEAHALNIGINARF